MSPDDQHRAAIARLREASRQQWVDIADGVLEHALKASRSSLPLRARTADGPIWIAEQVVVAQLQRAIDADLDGAAVGRVAIVADHRHVLQKVTIELFGRYGYDLLVLADQARDVADAVLWQSLGLDQVDVSIAPLHMHFTDVTVGDPHDVDPADET